MPRAIAISSLLIVATVASSTTAHAQEAIDESTETGSSSIRPLGWLSLGVGGVLAASSLYASHRVASWNEDDGIVAYRNSVPQGEDVCDAADKGYVADVPGASSPGEVSDACSSAKRWETAQTVTAFAGLGTLITGIVILATTDGDEAAEDRARAGSVRVEPAVSERGGALRLHVAF